MKSLHLVVAAFAAMGAAASAQAHAGDPGRRIEVACSSESTLVAAIAGAMERGDYWAPQSARRRMLSLARRACGRGATIVTFIPPADQRSCRTAPTWSTFCVDRTATMRAPDPSVSAGRRRSNEPDVTPTVEIAL